MTLGRLSDGDPFTAVSSSDQLRAQAMRTPRFQFKLVVVMGSIAFLAAGMAALKQPYQPAITILLTLTIATLLASSIRAPLAPSRKARAWWFGFSLFGWAHLLLVGSGWREWLPTTAAVDSLALWYMTHYGPYPTPNGRGPWYTNAIHEANGLFYRGAFKLGEIYLTLLFAAVGAVLTIAIAGRCAERSTEVNARPTQGTRSIE
jgi:hypothetical protein